MLKIPHLEEIILSFFFFLRIQQVFITHDSYPLIEGDTLNSFLLFFSSIKTSLKSFKRKDIYVLFNKEKISFIYHNLVVQYGA
jgi:hypothetical protein